jgi:hypothetical protein
MADSGELVRASLLAAVVLSLGSVMRQPVSKWLAITEGKRLS